ncbi:MAG: hypothetical protein CME19_05420 [Gemmatimonadetes bacterium]|nr:hypothetical protein [Gemmatimonadota bacterium]
MPESSGREAITIRSIVLGILTIAGMTFYITHFGWNLIKNYMPVSALIPFVVWLGINSVLRVLAPRSALTKTEMLTVFFMVWLVGNLPTTGWAGYLLGDISAPAQLSSPENRVGEVIGPLLPDWLFLAPNPVVVGGVWVGLPDDVSIPWQPWVRPVFWWSVGSMSIVLAGFFGSVLLFKQWNEIERLTFPMSAFPTDMLAEEPGRRFPAVFYTPVFWIGFVFAAGILCWNVAGYFVHTIPHIRLFDHWRSMAVPLGRDFPDYYLRIQPVIMGLSYLCPLDLLFSFWFYNVVNIIKEGIINRTGFSVGLQGQQAGSIEILMLESHGALVLLVGWSLWISRAHLKDTLNRALSTNRSQDDGVPIGYRTAWLGLAASVLFLGGWCVSAGMDLWATCVQLALIFVALFGVAKYAAATGFTFLSPGGNAGLGADKGATVMRLLGGTANLSPGTLTTMWMVNRNALAGMPIRLTGTMSIPHYFKMLGNHLRRHPLIWGAIPVAYIAGCLFTVSDSMYRSYADGGMNGPLYDGDWSHLVQLVPFVEGTRLQYADPGKWAVWGAGMVQAFVLIHIRNRWSWWPFHPAAIAFPTRRYGFSLLVVWISKLLVMRLGGVRLYRRSLPLWYGFIVGYLFGVALSTVVDFIWFPDLGHWVHGW